MQVFAYRPIPHEQKLYLGPLLTVGARGAIDNERDRIFNRADSERAGGSQELDAHLATHHANEDARNVHAGDGGRLSYSRIISFPAMTDCSPFIVLKNSVSPI